MTQPLIPQNAVVIGSANSFTDDYCVYEHWFGDPDQLIYIGVCQLRDVFAAPDAATNLKWAQIVNRAHSLTVRIVALGDRKECYRHRIAMIRAQPVIPPCNNMQNIPKGEMQIRCDQTGQTFKTQRDIADTLGISQPRVSTYMSRRKGTLKGFTFSYVPPEE